MARLTVLSLPIALALSGCSETGGEAARLEFLCEGGESFSLRFDAASRTATLQLADRSETLELVPGGSGYEYTGGGITLWTEAPGADFVEVQDADAHRNCHLRK